MNMLKFSPYLSPTTQVKLRFDDGFVAVLQPIHEIVGIEFRDNPN